MKIFTALTIAGSDSSGGGNVTLHPIGLTRDVEIAGTRYRV